ncbi:hypothetical protein BN4901_3387 [Citrobacter europaeus]|uniref:Uncharacterized protein n=1 Tax=Citrobacter europaeus TaxID=1914243 RepID=A0ABY0JS73_9ENTR|nr:hypothetical protein BN4901_3387 [Citrobacter europaeus]
MPTKNPGKTNPCGWFFYVCDSVFLSITTTFSTGFTTYPCTNWGKIYPLISVMNLDD